MKAEGLNKYITLGNNRDVVKYVVECYKKWREQPVNILGDLYGIPEDEQCYAIFEYVLENVAYKEDMPGYQFIKSPARLLTDKVGDCKSMTLFICSCLHCLGIPHTIRFVNFDGGSQYTHVYPIAHTQEGMIILDAVERDAQGKPIYNYARPFIKNKDIYFNE